MDKEPVCIRRANTIEEAEILLAWLSERGVEATLLDPDNPGVLAFGVTDVEGIEIMVADEETARRATALLAEHDKAKASPAADETLTGTLDVTCEECGEIASFDRDLAGTVQECPSCGAYLDMPGNGK